MRISIIDIIEGFGERKKDVFLISQEVEVSILKGNSQINYIYNFEQAYAWTNTFKLKIYRYISKNKTGLALTELINYFQKKDIELLNSLIIIQSQWNEGRNKNIIGIINHNEWLQIQSKVNHSILELLKNIEENIVDLKENIPPIQEINNHLKNIRSH